MIQPVCHTSSNPAVQSISPWFGYKDAMGNNLQNLAKIKLNAIRCTPLMYRASHLITEGNQAGSAQFTHKQYHFFHSEFHVSVLRWLYHLFQHPPSTSVSLYITSNISLTRSVFILEAATQDFEISFSKTQKLSWQSSQSYLAHESMQTSLKEGQAEAPALPLLIHFRQAKLKSYR